MIWQFLVQKNILFVYNLDTLLCNFNKILKHKQQEYSGHLLVSIFNYCYIVNMQKKVKDVKILRA